jgi:class 3 adenylate cyclase
MFCSSGAHDNASCMKLSSRWEGVHRCNIFPSGWVSAAASYGAWSSWAWPGLVGWHDRNLRALFGEYGGEEVDHSGDGFFVAFPDPKSAVECAAAVQRRLAAHRRTNGFAPEVRIGVHAAEASRSAAGYSGKGVHEAARVGALGGPGEIYASLATVLLVDGIVHSEPERVTLKGISEPIDVVTIDWR